MSRHGADDAVVLVLRGTIASIEPLGDNRSRHRWQVTLQVEEVLMGEFAGSTFAFPIHSPTKSGLATGQRRTVRASRSNGGYLVDGLQWLPGRAT